MDRPPVTVDNSPRYLTVAAVAELLHCTAQTVRNLCRRGVLPPPLALTARKHLWEARAVEAALERLRSQKVRER
jgi:hypothetical protein